MSLGALVPQPAARAAMVPFLLDNLSTPSVALPCLRRRPAARPDGAPSQLASSSSSLQPFTAAARPGGVAYRVDGRQSRGLYSPLAWTLCGCTYSWAWRGRRAGTRDTRPRAPTLVSASMPITISLQLIQNRHFLNSADPSQPRLPVLASLRSRLDSPPGLLHSDREDAPRCNCPSTGTLSRRPSPATLCAPCRCSGTGPALVRETRRPFVLLRSAGHSPAWLVWQ